jgi:hypothetical protein
MITAFSNFVVGSEGNEGLVVGFIIFIIIIAVQAIVITKGATRIAEVAARFTLDALPGKQMALESELSQGNIDPKEHAIRKDNLQQEVDFYGSMDGATKFISGNVKVGIFITAVNIIGGTFIMNGGAITGNAGEGVRVGDGAIGSFQGRVKGNFTMNGGTISGNTNPEDRHNWECGGGVHVGDGGFFTMIGGTITGNSAVYGGGVYVFGSRQSFTSFGTFNMIGGTISGNTASEDGGGVYVYCYAGSGIFRIQGGTVYGSGEGANSNTDSGTGAALYKNIASYDSTKQGIAQYGTFATPGVYTDANWTSKGIIETRNTTIRVVNGVLQ